MRLNVSHKRGLAPQLSQHAGFPLPKKETNKQRQIALTFGIQHVGSSQEYTSRIGLASSELWGQKGKDEQGEEPEK